MFETADIDIEEAKATGRDFDEVCMLDNAGQLAKFNGEHIAFLNGQVIDHDADLSVLKGRLDADREKNRLAILYTVEENLSF